MSPALRVMSCDMYRGNDNFVQSSEQWCCDGVSDCSFDHSSSENINNARSSGLLGRGPCARYPSSNHPWHHPRRWRVARIASQQSRNNSIHTVRHRLVTSHRPIDAESSENRSFRRTGSGFRCLKMLRCAIFRLFFFFFLVLLYFESLAAIHIRSTQCVRSLIAAASTLRSEARLDCERGFIARVMNCQKSSCF
jgi:hypothetical protein